MGVVVGVVGAEVDGGVDVGVAEVDGVVVGAAVVGGVDEVGAAVTAVVGATVVGAADVAALSMVG